MRLGQGANSADYVAPGAYASASGATGGLDPVANPNVDTRPAWIRFRDWLADSSIVNAATAARDYTVDETSKVIDNLYTTGLEFQGTMEQLKSMQNDAARSPELQDQYNNLVSRGNVVNSVITNAVTGAQAIAQWVKDNIGTDLSMPAPSQLRGLGFVQLVPAAVLGAALAAIALASAWIVDARSAIQKIQAMKDAGLSPEQISQALKQGGLGSAVSSISGLVVVGGLLLAGIYFAPELKRLIRGG